MNSGILAEPSIVGRERELGELQQYLNLAAKGKGTLVFVSGEAGSGKTRLATAFLDSVKRRGGIKSLTGWCLSEAGIPYFPFIEAFSTYFSSLDKGKLTGNSSEVSVSGTPNAETVDTVEQEVNLWLKGPVQTGLSGTVELSPQTWKDLTFQAIRKALASISSKEPTILFIDDVQWADSASLALLHYLSRTLQDQRVLVLATFRNEDITPSEEGHTHPLAEALRLMGRDALFHEIKLSGLSKTDVCLLAEHMVGGTLQSSLAEKLENQSQGNPLFVVESLRMLSEKNCLFMSNNKWCISTDEVGVPNKIRDIILDRLGRLKQNQRRILEVASVIGTKFEPEILAGVLGMDSLEVIETLDGISQASSLIVCDGSRYRFDHVKSRDAIYEGVSPALRRAYHGKIAEKLEASSKKKQVSDLACHFALAGNKEKAISYSLAAGEEALSFVLGTEAIKHFKYVLNNIPDDAEHTSQRERAMEGYGDGLLSNASSESIKVFEKLSKSTSSVDVMLRATRKAAHASLLEGNFAHALDLVDKAPINLSQNRLERARFLTVKGQIEGGVDWAQNLWKICRMRLMSLRKNTRSST